MFKILEKNILLSGSKNILQFNINNKLITVIGEEHYLEKDEENFTNCKESFVPIRKGRKKEESIRTKTYEYIYELVESNIKNDKKILVFLEYGPDFKHQDILNTNSYNLKQVYQILNKKGIQTYGIDERRKLLHYEYQNALYDSPETYKINKENSIYDISSNVFEQVYINPLKHMIKEYKKILDTKFINKNYYKILNKSLDELYDLLNTCIILFNKNWTGNDSEKFAVIHNFRHLYKNYVDFCLSLKIFEAIDEDFNIVVLIGNEHISNLDRILGTQIIYNKFTNNNECLSIKNSYIY